MPETNPESVMAIASRFDVGGEVVAVERHGSGHIHETWASRVESGGESSRFIHQRLNRSVFPSPERLMDNLERVTGHLRAKIVAEGGDPRRESLTLVPSADGGPYLRTESDEIWRTFTFIEGATARDTATSPDHAYQVGRAFGRFLERLADLPPPRLHETIPHFGDGRRILAAFLDALAIDPEDRARSAWPEVTFARDHEMESDLLIGLLEERRVPERVIHFDTKINNVLVDAASGEAVCVIDLDTVMPGTALYDFGDAVRLGACRAAEDETDLSKVEIDLDLFDGLTRGWMEGAGRLLVGEEIEQLVPAARSIAYTMGVRFLADFLAGDTYFRTSRQDHNLHRCRTQFALVRDIGRKLDELRSIVDRYR
jgi:hypothetical protein